MAFSNRFFDRVEKKTSVNKETILSLAKKLQKLQGCNKYLPLGARPVSAGQVQVYVLSGAPCQYIRLKELRLGSWELRLTTWAAAFQRKLYFKGSYILSRAMLLWELQLRLLKSKREK